MTDEYYACLVAGRPKYILSHAETCHMLGFYNAAYAIQTEVKRSGAARKRAAKRKRQSTKAKSRRSR